MRVSRNDTRFYDQINPLLYLPQVYSWCPFINRYVTSLFVIRLFL